MRPDKLFEIVWEGECVNNKRFNEEQTDGYF